MRIIITGGTGLIGRALVGALAGDGHEIVVLSRNPDQHKSLFGAGVRLERWDGISAEGWGKLADAAGEFGHGPEMEVAIVNLAGENISGGRWTAERKRRILSSRVNAGQAVNLAVEQATRKPFVVIQASAVGYYGACGDQIITEDTLPGNDFLAQVCQAWEGSTAPAEERDGVRRPIIRTGVVLSARGGALPLMALPFRLFAGGPVGSGGQWLPWIHIQDELNAIRFLIDNPQATGPYNLSAPNPLTNRDFGKALAKVLHRPSIIPAPSGAIKLLLGEMATILLDGQRAVPKRLEEAGFMFKYPHAEGALAEIYD